MFLRTTGVAKGKETAFYLLIPVPASRLEDLLSHGFVFRLRCGGVGSVHKLRRVLIPCHLDRHLFRRALFRDALVIRVDLELQKSEEKSAVLPGSWKRKLWVIFLNS